MPKITMLVRKAQTKGKVSVLEKTRSAVESTIKKVRRGVILERGPHLRIESEDEFDNKLRRACYVSKQVERTKLLIQQSIQKATSGEDVELLASDCNITDDEYKQIVSKLYASIRFEIYRQVKQRRMCLKPDTDETFNDLESPERTHESQMLDESEIRDLIQTLDTDHISREVFALFGVQFN